MSDEVVQLAIGGMFFGVLCSIAPLVIAVTKGKAWLAITSLVLCAIAGAILGVFLAGPLALILCAVGVTLDSERGPK